MSEHVPVPDDVVLVDNVKLSKFINLHGCSTVPGIPDGKTLDGKTLDGKTLDGKTLDGKDT